MGKTIRQGWAIWENDSSSKAGSINAAFALVAMLWSATALSAGFDCKEGRTKAEQVICSTPELLAMDDDLRALYRPYGPNTKKLEKPTVNQQWIKRRNGCGGDIECLRDAYVERISELLRSRASALSKTPGASAVESKLRLNSGWVIDDREDPGTSAPCPELRDYMNRKAAYWWRLDTGRYISECSAAAATAPFFKEPSWLELDLHLHKKLLSRLLRYRDEGPFDYFKGVGKHDNEYYEKQASQFIEHGGSLKILSIQLLDNVTDVYSRELVMVKDKAQLIAQLGFPIPLERFRKYREPGCDFPEQESALILLNEEMDGPAPFYAPELFSTILKFFRGHPALFTVTDNETLVIFPRSEERDCKLRLIEQLSK